LKQEEKGKEEAKLCAGFKVSHNRAEKEGDKKDKRVWRI